MKKAFFISACGLLLLCGCTQENLPLENNNIEGGSSNPNRITLQQALRISDSMLAQINGRKTRSGFRSVRDVKIISQEKTRRAVNGVDTMFYIVNYANNQGFAVLSADKRLAPVYAISDKGSLNESDTLKNPALKSFFMQMRVDAQNIQNGTGIGPVDPPVEPPVEPKDSTDYGYGDKQYKFGPLLPKTTRYMTRANIAEYLGEPEENISDIFYWVLFTTMANQWPEMNNGKVYDWNAISVNVDYNIFSGEIGYDPDDPLISEVGKIDLDDDGSTIKDFISDIWSGLNQYTDGTKNPGDGGTGITENIFMKIMRELGYTFTEPSLSSSRFDPAGVKNLIFQKSPVIAYVKNNESDNWVIDGWWMFGPHKPIDWGDLQEWEKEDHELFHCHWIDAPENNGWFMIYPGWIANQPMATEPGEQTSTIESRSNIRYITTSATPDR